MMSSRYEWHNGAMPIRGELDARQVADMAAAGTALAVVREYRCTRGTERHWGEHTEAEVSALVADGWACEVGEPWPMEAPAAPSLAALRSAALERYRGEAGECLRRSLPAPWDVLRAVATAEYQAWADEFCALVAAELARIEAAVAAAESAAELDAIVADWPEVE